MCSQYDVTLDKEVLLNPSFGVKPPCGQGQTWQSLTASRASGTSYTNSTSQPIVVMINSTATVGGVASITPVVGGVSLPLTAIQSPTGSTSIVSQSFIVPPGSTYQATIGGATFTWAELR